MCTTNDCASVASYHLQTLQNAAQHASGHHAKAFALATFLPHAAGQSAAMNHLPQHGRASNGGSMPKSTFTSTTTLQHAGGRHGARHPGHLGHAPRFDFGRSALGNPHLARALGDERRDSPCPPTMHKTRTRRHVACDAAPSNGNRLHGDDPKRGWSSTVQNNKATIDLGNYNLELNKNDSSMVLTNKKTGDKTRIWGDPHIKTNDASGTFHGPITFYLPDHAKLTKVTVGTQPNGSASYADQVTITRGNNAYSVSGLSQKNSNPLTVQSSNNGRALDRQAPDGYTLLANRSGIGWIDPATGRAPTAADFSRA